MVIGLGRCQVLCSRGMDWEVYKLMQPTRVQGMSSPMRFKNSDLRSKCATGTYRKYMLPLLPRCVLGMPPILIVLIVGMSKKARTRILGLTKTNYNAPRIGIEIQDESQVNVGSDHIVQSSPITSESVFLPFLPFKRYTLL